MLLRRFFCAALIPISGLGLLTLTEVDAQTSIPGGANSNPSTSSAPSTPDDKDKSSDDDKGDGGAKPPEPQPDEPEGKVDCTEDDKEPDQPKAEDGGPPSAPSSVDLSFSLDACPLEYSVAVGKLRLYFDKAEENMGDPIYLNYHSVAGSKISEEITTGLPAGVVKRYTIQQLSGKPLSFDVLAGTNGVLKPSGSGARSRARVELRTETGVTTDPALVTRIRQYRSAGGFMEFSAANKNILRWEGPTGRTLTFPVDPQAGTTEMGLEVLREGTKIRQVKSPAGLLDVVADEDGRGYQVVTYLPSEIGPKAGGFYSLASNAKPKRTVHVVHPLGTTKLVATFTDHSPDSAADRVRKLTYTYIQTFDGGHEWDMMTEADGMTLVSTRHVVPDHDVAGMRRVVREVKDGSGTLLTRKEVVQQFEEAWKGWTDVQEIETPGGKPELRTVRSYRHGKNPSANDFRKINWMMTETGRVYEFKYDTQGRMIERRSPWLDGAGGQLIVETYAYEPLVAGEVVQPGDERPRTTTVAVGGAVISKSYFAAYSDGGRHTVINEDAATPGSAFGNAANRSKKQVFYAAGTLVESGRLMESFDENGLKTQYAYVARAGGGLVETVTGPLTSSGAAKAGVSRRIVTEKDAFNRQLLKREALYTGSAYVDFQEDVNQYSAQGQLMSVVRTDLKSGRQRTLSSYQWRGDQMVGGTSAEGAISQTVLDGFDRPVTSTSSGVPEAASPLGSASYPARPPITRTTTGTMIADLNQANWGDRTVTTTAGDLTLVETLKADARGRVTEETDADGYTTQTIHLKNGLETLITRPDGGTILTKYFLDGRLKERSGTGIVPEFYSYSANAAGGITATVFLGSPNSVRYRTTTTDMLGRAVSQITPGHGGVITSTTSYVGGTNRILKVTTSAPLVPVKLYEYDSFGSPTRQAATIRPGASAIDPGSPSDRIQEVETSVLNDASGLWLVSKQFTYPHEGATAANRFLLSETRNKIAGFTGDETQCTYGLDALGNWRQQRTEEQIADRLRIERTTSNEFTGETVNVYHGGLLVEQRSPGDTSSMRMSYDGLGRLVATKQARHVNASVIAYALGGNRVVSSTDASGVVTQFSYYPQGTAGAGKVAATTFDNNTVKRQAYDLHGNRTYEWGSATAPVAYTYNVFDELETLATYRDKEITGHSNWPTGGTADVTSWVREASTGLLLQKRYADNQGPAYQYSLDGKVTKRTSARGIMTDYQFTAWGELDTVDYADATPDVNIDYDRLGRKKRESNGVAQTDFAYDPATLLLDTEMVSYDLDGQPGFEFSRVLDRSNDSLGRSTGWQLKNGANVEHQAGYAYDEASGRLAAVTSPGGTFSYLYTPNSSLVGMVSGPAHTVTNTWEPNRDVLDVKENKAGLTVVSRFDYTVNSMSQRTKVEQSGTAFTANRTIDWGYDSLRQLVSADSSDNAADRSYLYDSIGNRKRSADGLTPLGTDNYTANALNQYAALQFNPQVAIVNPEYDADGNATAYPLTAQPSSNVTLSWDAENRLIASTVKGLTTSYQYDSQSRRIAKTTEGSGTLFVYDGWNCLAEYEKAGAGSATLQRTHLWGLDLDGTFQGAGGVGGLLAVRGSGGNYFPTYDGNGNVSEYLTTSNALAAHFEYDPFGRLTVDTDADGLFNARFSSKPQDVETGLYYYGYRYYDPLAGRWLNRDPIGERDGGNIYAFSQNNGLNLWDVLGLNAINDSVSHYYWGGGVPLDLVSGGHSSEVDFLFANESWDWLEKAKKDIESKSAELFRNCNCKNKGEVYKETIEIKGHTQPYNKTFASGLGFVLGKGVLFSGYTIEIQVDCCACLKKAYGWTRHSIRDAFADPIDVGGASRRTGKWLTENFGNFEENPGAVVGTLGIPAAVGSGLKDVDDLEVGGDPYKINADWKNLIYISETSRDCPCGKK